MTLPHHIPGHAIVCVGPRQWACTCGKPLAPTRDLAREAMSWHRVELWLSTHAADPDLRLPWGARVEDVPGVERAGL